MLNAANSGGEALLLLFEILGLAFVLLAVLLAFLFAFALLSVLLVRSGRRVPFPKFSLFVLSVLHEPLRWLLTPFGSGDGGDLLERVAISLGNDVNFRDFVNFPLTERILILPQCLRSVECPAKLDAFEGIKCVKCGRCEIATLKNICDSLGIRLFISPGGTFTKRILMQNRDKAVVGVACIPNLYEGLLLTRLIGITAQGIPLLTTGCVGTSVDYEEVLRRLLAR